MKEQKLPRRQARENAFLTAFALTFQSDAAQEAREAMADAGGVPLDAYARGLLDDMAVHSAEIDGLIAAHLKGWTLARVPRVSIVALRVALAEMLYGSEQKPGVAINEAVELVKKYGAENDYQFVNGLLGTVARERGGDGASC